MHCLDRDYSLLALLHVITDIKLQREIIAIRRNVISSTCHFLVSAFTLQSGSKSDSYHSRVTDITLRATSVPIYGNVRKLYRINSIIIYRVNFQLDDHFAIADFRIGRSAETWRDASMRTMRASG